MNRLFQSVLLLMAMAMAASSSAQQTGDVSYNPNLVRDTTKKSIKSRAVGIIKGDTVQIDYYSPGVRGRIIWGGLVPYDDVWVTGAHSATCITIGKPIVVNGTNIPAGKYGFFTIPGKETWTLILNRNWDQHLADDYDAKDDIVRVIVKPIKVSHTERLQYFVEPGMGNKFVLAVAWENLRVELPGEVGF